MSLGCGDWTIIYFCLLSVREQTFGLSNFANAFYLLFYVFPACFFLLCICIPNDQAIWSLFPSVWWLKLLSRLSLKGVNYICACIMTGVAWKRLPTSRKNWLLDNKNWNWSSLFNEDLVRSGYLPMVGIGTERSVLIQPVIRCDPHVPDIQSRVWGQFIIFEIRFPPTRWWESNREAGFCSWNNLTQGFHLLDDENRTKK